MTSGEKAATFGLARNDFESLETAEERLSWLMERPSSHTEIGAGEMTPERRVPGCVSGLWLRCEERSGALVFHARSESAVVQGVAAFLCELYSFLTPEEVSSLGASLVAPLGIEELLTTTRKRAVANVVAFITASARAAADGRRSADAPL